MRATDFKLDVQTDNRQSGAVRNVQVVAVTGGSRGSGTTSVALNIAQAISQAGRKTLLLDMDRGESGAGAILGLRDRCSLLELLDGDKDLGEVLMPGPDGMQVIAATSSTFQIAGLRDLECVGMMRAFSELDFCVDTLVIDAAFENGRCVSNLCGAASEVIVTVGDDAESVASAVRLIHTLQRDQGISRFHILPCLVHSAAQASRVFVNVQEHFSASHELALGYCGFVPYDVHVVRACASGQSVLSAFPRSRAALSLRNLGARIMTWSRPAAARGHLEFFVERLVQNENINEEVRS